jgi:hypothetical protein
MKIELTDKEVESIGYDRYYKNKYVLTVISLLGFVLLGMIGGLVVEKCGYKLLGNIITIAIVVPGFVQFVYYLHKANQAGKKFLKEQKEVK